MNRTVLTSLLLLLGFATLQGQQTSAASPILVNHVGFMPQAAKHCLIPGSTSVAYEIIDTATGQELRLKVPFKRSNPCVPPR